MENSVNRNKQIIIKICFCLVLFYVGVMICDIGDYPAHRSHIETQSLWNILGGGSGYPLYFAFMRIVYVALNCPIIYAQGIVTGGCLVLSYLLCIYFLKQQLLQYNVKEIVIYTFTWILFICGQIWVPWSSKSIIHYTSPNIWHNGTNIVGRCFGILAFFYLIKCLKIITDSDFTCLPTVRNFKEATFICVISVMAKPSFAQSFAPAFGVYLFFLFIISRGKFTKGLMWFLGVCIIPLIYIMWQSLYYFGPNGHNTIKTGEKLEFYFTGNIFQELQYPLIIMAFAIIMIAITVIKREMDVYYLISILMFIIARLEVLFVHGSAQGEMGWGFYIATFFVFLISIKNYIRFFWSEDSWCGSRILFDLSTVALFLHVITGGYYLIMYIWGDWLGY